MIGLRTFPFLCRMVKKKWFLYLCLTPSRDPTTCQAYSGSILRIQRWIKYSPSFVFFFFFEGLSLLILVIINLSLSSWDCVPYTQTGYPTPSYSGSYRILFSSLVAGENFATTLGILHSSHCGCSGPCQAMVNLAWVGGRAGFPTRSAQQVKR